MPISKNGVAYYTKEQLETARSAGNALEYARQQGYELIKENSYYRMKDHNSLVFYPNGNFVWNSQGVSGGVLNFMIYYENRTMVDAVLSIAGDQSYMQQQPAAAQRHENANRAPDPAQQQPEKIFREPEKDQDNRKIFYYLIQRRGLDKSVVQEMIRQDLVYQSIQQRPNGGRPIHNVTFVYKDNEGNAVGAFQRGMIDFPNRPAYKRDVPGSNKDYGWQLKGVGDIRSVKVFESAIDAASDASLDAMNLGTWQYTDRLSMEGVAARGLWIEPLKNYLLQHPNTSRVDLMLDADPTGRAAAAAIRTWLSQNHPSLEVVDRGVPYGCKDWNEVLMLQQAALEDNPPREAPAPAREEMEME